MINTGSIYALQAELKSSGNPYGYAIKQEGLVEATGTLEHEGRIYLVAGEGMNISSGTMIAKGGTIHMFGEKVGLLDEALVDASADYDGGTLFPLLLI